jgi:hypothetical protein
MSPNSIELHRVRCCEQDRPMGRVERWQEREAGVDQVDAIGDEELASVSHDGAHPGQPLEIAVQDLKNREAPDSPSVVTLRHRTRQKPVVECASTEPHNNETRRSGLVAKNHLLGHHHTLPSHPPRATQARTKLRQFMGWRAQRAVPTICK